MIFKKKKASCGEVDIYLEEKDLPNYFAESYQLLNDNLKYQLYNIQKYNTYSGSRKAFINLLKKANIQNAQNVKVLVEILEPNVQLTSYSDIREKASNVTQMTLKDFWYLRRDWCYTEEGEKQINLVVDVIKEQIINIDSNKQNSLFLGSGVGRLAAEFTDIFNMTYATDKSYSMIWHLKQLLNGENIKFFDPRPKNVLKLENVAEQYTAKIPKKKLSEISNKMGCFVSDVLDLPLHDQSIDSIFSIYFTDVIALKLWFNQINKTLSNNGLFIHFGPLDYFFSDEREMLTAEEFKLFFENNGYKTLVDKVVETPHLEDKNSMSYKVYRNWFFIAQKQKRKQKKIDITNETILELNQELHFERKGILSSKGEMETEVNLSLPSGVFEGASSVIDILSVVNGERNFEEIIRALEEKTKDKIDVKLREQIKSMLVNFIEEGVIKIS